MREWKALYIALLILTYGFSQAQKPVINEIMTMNDTTIDDIEGDSPDWIELFNPTSGTINLENWSLSDDKDNPGKWSFDKEARIQPYGFALIFASGKDYISAESHASFRLDAGKEPVLLVSPEGDIVDSIMPRCIPEDVSYGRQTDGSKQYTHFAEPSPGYTNNHSGFAEVPIISDTLFFSQNPGYHENPVEVEILNQDTTSEIYYTLNGTVPHPDNELYKSPVAFENRTPEENDESDYQTADNWKEPEGKVLKGTMLRAVSYKDGCPQSRVKSGTFFIGEAFGEIFSRIQVMSLGMDEDSLFDQDGGVYINEQEDISRPAFLDYYNLSGERYQAASRIELINDNALNKSQKSFKVWIPDSSFNSSFHDNVLFNLHDTLLVTSPMGANDLSLFGSYLMAEEFKTSLPERGLKPVVVLINGEYWGIHLLTSSISTAFIEHHTASSSVELMYNCPDILRELEELNDKLEFASSISYAEKFLNINQLIDLILRRKIGGTGSVTPVLWKKASNSTKWQTALKYNQCNDHDHNEIWRKCSEIHKKLSQFRVYRSRYASIAIQRINSTGFLKSPGIHSAVFDHYAPLIPEHVKRWHFPSKIMEWKKAVDRTKHRFLQSSNDVLSDISSESWSPLRIFPNPASKRVSIVSPVSGQVEVFDSRGTSVYHQDVDQNEETSIDVGQWSRGIYIVKFSGDTVFFSGKLIVVP